MRLVSGFVFGTILAASSSLVVAQSAVSEPQGSEPRGQERFHPLRGPYMGQVAGDAPSIFLPGKISTGADEGCSIFVQGARTFLWRTVQDGVGKVLLLEDRDGRWQPPVPLQPLGPGSIILDLALAPDGEWFYLTAKSLQPDGAGEEIWKSRFESGEWGDPALLGSAVNSRQSESNPSLTRSGDLYFARSDPSNLSDGDLYVARWLESEFKSAVRLPEPVNSEYREYSPFVAPDESCLIFVSDREGGCGEGDLYISFRDDSGSWGVAVNLGPRINSDAEESHPSITIEGRYFFFTSNRVTNVQLPPGIPPAGSMPGGGSRDIYWMKADFIESLRSSPSATSSGLSPHHVEKCGNDSFRFAAPGPLPGKRELPSR